MYLGPGEQVSGNLCPFCDGGEDKEKSFSVGRKETGVIVFKCHRNKCGRGGAVFPDGSPLLQVHTKTKEHEVFTDPTEQLTMEHLKFFEKKYGLKPVEILRAGFLYVPKRDAVWQPIHGPNGEFRGQVVRRYADKRIWTYKAEANGRYPLLAWFSGPENCDQGACILVEDILSAIKLSRYHNSVAINGTSLSNDMILEVMRHSSKQYLALDKDATAHAIKMAHRWNQLLDITVIECKRDPKYWLNHELETLKEYEDG